MESIIKTEIKNLISIRIENKATHIIIPCNTPSLLQSESEFFDQLISNMGKSF